MNETVQTPIGLIPSDWVYKEIGPHIEMSTGPAFDSTRFSDDSVGIRLARGINITKGHFRWSRDITKFWLKVTPDIEKYLLCANDVVIGMDGSLVGRNYALVTPDDIPSLLVQRVARLRTDKFLDCRFLYYFMASDFWLSHVDVVKTNSGIPHISNGDIRAFRIAFPSIAQQRKIARILTTVDNLIEKTEALIAKYQAIKQGMMHDLFTRGVDKHGHLRPSYEESPELYKQSELGWIPKEWEAGRLTNYTMERGGLKPGPFGSSLTKDMYKESGFRVYGQEQVLAKSLAEGDYYVDAFKFNELHEFQVAANDILMTLVGVGTVGKVLVVQPPFEAGIINPRLMRIRLDKSKGSVEFVKHLIPSPMVRNQFNQFATGGTMPVLNASVVRKVCMPVLPVQEQETIGMLLDGLDDRLISERECLLKHRLFKTGLMQDLLTGKVRVKVDEAEEVAP